MQGGSGVWGGVGAAGVDREQGRTLNSTMQDGRLCGLEPMARVHLGEFVQLSGLMQEAWKVGQEVTPITER